MIILIKKKILFLAVIMFHFLQQGISQTLVSQGKTAWASSVEGGNTAARAVDGNMGTRWGSNWSGDPNPANAWWAVDLGKEYYITSVEINWEGAYAKEYKIQISSDNSFSTYTDIATVTNGDGNLDVVPTNLNIKGRYLRILGITRGTGYGYSFWECRIYGTETLTPVPIAIHVPYVQYLELGFNPEDIHEKREIIIQNTDSIVTLTFNEGSPLTISLLDFRGDFDVDLWSLRMENDLDTLRGLPLQLTVYNDMIIHVRLTPRPPKGNVPPVADAGIDKILYLPENSLSIDGSKSSDPDGNINAYQWSQVSGPTTAVMTNTETAIEIGRASWWGRV